MPFASAPALLEPLVAWFAAEGRRLPWRALDLDANHPDPYAVLVSELMLQQTQVVTVIPYFERWLLRFPDPESLARASEEEVHKHWEGLGYYRRARFLQAAAARIATHGWPRDLAGLLELPGLGPYTAAAVASIAFQLPEPALDGNAFRVLARLLALPEEPSRRAAELREWLRPALALHGPSRITQALMELGATHCAPRPACARCPLAGGCEALRQGLAERIPPPKARPEVKTESLWLVALTAEGHWLLERPRAKGLLAGLWRWPSLADGPEPADRVSADRAADPQRPYNALELRQWPGWTQVYSHRKELVSPVALALPARFPAPEGCEWIEAAALPHLPMGKRDQRLRELLTLPGGPGLLEVPAAWLLAQLGR